MTDAMDMNERERRRCLIEAAREANTAARAEISAELDANTARAVFTRPIEDRLAADRRRFAEREQRIEQQREREAATPPATSPADWDSWLSQRLATERSFVLECVGQAIGGLMRKERRTAKGELNDEVRRLRIELAAACETVDELRRVVAASNRSGGGAIIDLPARRTN